MWLRWIFRTAPHAHRLYLWWLHLSWITVLIHSDFRVTLQGNLSMAKSVVSLSVFHTPPGNVPEKKRKGKNIPYRQETWTYISGFATILLESISICLEHSIRGQSVKVLGAVWGLLQLIHRQHRYASIRCYWVGPRSRSSIYIWPSCI